MTPPTPASKKDEAQRRLTVTWQLNLSMLSNVDIGEGETACIGSEFGSFHDNGVRDRCTVLDISFKTEVTGKRHKAWTIGKKNDLHDQSTPLAEKTISLLMPSRQAADSISDLLLKTGAACGGDPGRTTYRYDTDGAKITSFPRWYDVLGLLNNR